MAIIQQFLLKMYRKLGCTLNYIISCIQFILMHFWIHFLRYGLGQMAPGSLNRSRSSRDLNDSRLGAHTTCGESQFHCSGIFLEKLWCGKFVLNGVQYFEAIVSQSILIKLYYWIKVYIINFIEDLVVLYKVFSRPPIALWE